MSGKHHLADRFAADLTLWVTGQRLNRNVQPWAFMARHALEQCLAVFLPLNLMAGIFGMNFEFMSVLHLEYGFETCIAGMVLIAAGLMFYFRRKHYLDL
jgi:hypothetical protein